MHTNKAMLTVLGNLEDFLSSKFVSWVVEMVLEKGGPWTPVRGAKTHKLYVDSGDGVRKNTVQLC